MKKVITSIIAVTLPLFTLLSSLHAQEVSTMATTSRTLTPVPGTSISAPAARIVPAVAKPARVIRRKARKKKQFNRITQRFVDHFEGVNDISWTKQQVGYAGTFTKDGLRNIVWYNQDGDITYLMIAYHQEKLPAYIKVMVRRANKAYRISVINEIHHADEVIYLVTLENDCHIKQVTVCNGEMNVFTALEKAA